MTIALARPAAGDVDVLVRPEHLAIARANGDADAAVITFVEYYGHDAMVSLRHPDAGELRARLLGTIVELGDRVRVRYVGERTVAFPRRSPATQAVAGRSLAGAPSLASPDAV